jgi:hypothetical protein
MSETEFDWSPLGEGFWREAQATTGASDLQTKFAACRHRGMTASGSARASGYSGDGDAIRQAGSRAAKSTAVMELLSLAAAEAGGGNDGVVTRDEARRILSRLARGSDPNVRVKSIESLQKLDALDAAERAQQKDEEIDTTEVRRDICCTLPLSGAGAAIILGGFFQRTSHIAGFLFLEELAPIVSKKFPDEWARWRAKYESHQQYQAYLKEIDDAANGPLLEGDALVAALHAKYPGKDKKRAANVGEPANA